METLESGLRPQISDLRSQIPELDQELQRLPETCEFSIYLLSVAASLGRLQCTPGALVVFRCGNSRDSPGAQGETNLPGGGAELSCSNEYYEMEL